MEMENDTNLISVLRRPDGFQAVWVCRRRAFQPPAHIRRASGRARIDRDPYEEKSFSFDHERVKGGGVSASVFRSWRALGRVHRFDEHALFHLLNVLIRCLPDPDAPAPAAPLSLPPEPSPVRATAAHRRAHRRTLRRPQKAKSPEPIDLRPYLSSARDINRLWVRLAPHLSRARMLLEKEGVRTENLSRLVDDRGRPVDVYMAVRHRAGERSVHSFPPGFIRYFLFWQTGRAFDDLREVLSLYWALDLEHDDPLRRAVARLLANVRSPYVLEWCRRIVDAPRARRTSLAELIHESKVWRVPCSEKMRLCLLRMDNLCRNRVYRHRMFALLSAVARGENPDYLMAGFELAEEFRPDFEFEDVGRGEDVPLEVIRSLPRSVARDPLGLWAAMGRQPGLAELFREIHWAVAPPDTARDFSDFLSGLSREDHWPVVRRHAREMFDRLRQIPHEYDGKMFRHLNELCHSRRTPGLLAGILPRYLEFLSRVCRDPFEAGGKEERLFAVLASVPAPEWERLAGAPDSVLLGIERAADRDNDVNLLEEGVRYVVDRGDVPVADALIAETGTVLQTVRTLGSVAVAFRNEAFAALKAHPLMRSDLETLPSCDLVGRVTAARPGGRPTPVPRKFRKFCEGSYSLTPGQAARARQVVMKGLLRIRWALLEELTLSALSSRVKARGYEPKTVHALRFYGNVRENRRSFRRFLMSYFRGNREYLCNHPLNRKWLQSARGFDRTAWLRGMKRRERLPDGTEVTIGVELDPLEALRLGTYVGSCTGLGGDFAYSAAAVVLDVNKHVIYARNPKGKVVGRQLAAISEEGELVTFDVYPVGVSEDIRDCFRRFDREFARALGVNLHRPFDENSPAASVNMLLAKEWYNDGAWDAEA